MPVGFVEAGELRSNQTAQSLKKYTPQMYSFIRHFSHPKINQICCVTKAEDIEDEIANALTPQSMVFF